MFNSINFVSSYLYLRTFRPRTRIQRLCERALYVHSMVWLRHLCVLPRRAEVVVTVCFVESIPRNHLVPTMICRATILWIRPSRLPRFFPSFAHSNSCSSSELILISRLWNWMDKRAIKYTRIVSQHVHLCDIKGNNVYKICNSKVIC